MFEKAKIKLIPQKNKDGTSPVYTVMYKAGPKKDGPASYGILSVLAADGDLILEMNTDLFFGEPKNKQNYVKEFISKIADFELEYITRKTPSIHRASLFGFVTDSRKKVEAQELLVYIPSAVWKSPEFIKIIPDCGVRYYMTKGPQDPKETLSALWNLSDEEKAEQFPLILFDLVQMEQIGIFSSSLGMDELKGLLGL